MVPSVLLTALREGFQKLINELRAIKAALTGLNNEDVSKAVKSQSVVITRAMDQLGKIAEKVANPEVSVAIDTTSLSKDIEALGKTLTEAFPKTDLSNVEASLSLIYQCLKESNTKKDAIIRGLAEVATAIIGLEIKVPEAFKLDDTQLRKITAAGSGVNGGQLAARNVDLANVSMALANTEYNYTFPANTVGWQLRVRANGVPLLVAYTTGKLPTSGDGLAYFTVPALFVESPSGLDWSGKKIYLQAATAAQTAELIIYKL